MKRLTFLMISFLAFAILSAVPAFAEQTRPKAPSEATMSEAELNGYSEDEWSTLKDNRLEYDEIKDMVHNFNPTMAAYWDSFDDSLRSVEYSVDIMREAKKEASDTYNLYKNNPYMAPMLKSMVTVASTMLTQYNNTYKKLEKGGSAAKQLKTAEDQLTRAIQQMMIGYKTIEANVKILKKLVELNEASVKTYESMRDEDMATDADVLKAKADLISASSSLASLESTRKQLYAQLITMCGWEAGDKVEIGDIPQTDEARIAAMDPEADFAKAAGNNSTLITLRGSNRNINAGALSAQDDYYTSMEDLLRVKLDTLYAAVVAAGYEYEGTQAGYEAAKIQKDAMEKQLESGMLSEAQYIGASIQVLQKEAALVTARNNLEQAVSAYEWAVKGYCDLN